VHSPGTGVPDEELGALPARPLRTSLLPLLASLRHIAPDRIRKMPTIGMHLRWIASRMTGTSIVHENVPAPSARVAIGISRKAIQKQYLAGAAFSKLVVR